MHRDRMQTLIDMIRNESLEHLRDPAYLEYRLLPELGLNDRHMHQYPSHLHAYCGHGLDSWQYPNQFSRYLVYLSQLDITSYVEIGCHKGGTFIITTEYLSRFGRLERALAIDNWPRDRIKAYQDINPIVDYRVASSTDSDIKAVIQSQSWDLVLIDGDHSYTATHRDWELVRDHARYIAFHDICNCLCPGTQQIWADMRRIYTPEYRHEWCDQYDEVLLRMRGSVMGIGLIKV